MAHVEVKQYVFAKYRYPCEGNRDGILLEGAEKRIHGPGLQPSRLVESQVGPEGVGPEGVVPLKENQVLEEHLGVSDEGRGVKVSLLEGLDLQYQDE